jgi:capsular exopolysaccharide family
MKSLTITHFPKLDYNTDESLNTMCTNLSLVSSDRNKIVVTSCHPKEGKSFIAMNLMRSLAGIGKRVVLVDADLRRSALVTQYAIQSQEEIIGLAHYLAGRCKAEEILFQSNIASAWLVPSGGKTSNSLPLLNTVRLKNLLDKLSADFDIVLVDAPPIGVIIDAAEIAKACDGILFVVADNEISRNELAYAVKQLDRTGCPILGSVLNKVSLKTRSARKYYYKAYYSHYGADGYYENGDVAAKNNDGI